MKNRSYFEPIKTLLPGWIYSIEKRRYKMPTYTVTKSDVSSKGKPRVFFDNRHAWQDAYYVSPKIQSPQVGMTIEADTSSQTFAGAKGATWFLNGWKPVTNGQAATPPAYVNTNKPQEWPSFVPAKPSKGWAIEPGDLSRFASNVVGSAIEAKLIEKPEDVEVWAAAAYRAAESLRTGNIKDFDDSLPQFVTPQGEADGGDDPGYDPGDEVPF